MTRVIAGSAGGLLLKSPKGSALRPTQDRIKQVIFSSLGDFIIGAEVLDLYAGTGGLGIEALSRGAARAVFVEKDRAAVAVIEENLKFCGLKGEVVQSDVKDFTRSKKNCTFQVIFADPPYDKQKSSLNHHPLLEQVKPLLRGNGIFIWEHYAAQTLSSPTGWEITRDKKYGETGLTFLKVKVEEVKS